MNKGPIVAAIVAMDEKRLIGAHGALPWHVPANLPHFKQLTTGHIVIMGRKTWESLPPKARPLPGRINIVISRSIEQIPLPKGVYGAHSPEEALAIARQVASVGQRIWIIGGAEIYKATFRLCDEVHVTKILGVHEGDAWLAPFEDEFNCVSEVPAEQCIFQVFARR